MSNHDNQIEQNLKTYDIRLVKMNKVVTLRDKMDINQRNCYNRKHLLDLTVRLKVLA